MRFAAAVLALSGFVVVCSSAPVARAASPAKTPILLELFTSEGCSSCPPADSFVRRLDAAQPLAGAQIIVLSEHVDYWDHDGWKDPYSSHEFTFRQEEYVGAFHLDSPYTPQIILDGTRVLDMSKPQELDGAFHQALAEAVVPVEITSLKIAASAPDHIQAHIEADGAHASRNADVYVAIALDHAESQVLRGENKGRDLQHVGVVESLSKIGKLEKGRAFSKDFEAKLKSGVDPANVRVIAFVQESGPGQVLGAAMERVGAGK